MSQYLRLFWLLLPCASIFTAQPGGCACSVNVFFLRSRNEVSDRDKERRKVHHSRARKWQQHLQSTCEVGSLPVLENDVCLYHVLRSFHSFGQTEFAASYRSSPVRPWALCRYFACSTKLIMVLACCLERSETEIKTFGGVARK